MHQTVQRQQREAVVGVVEQEEQHQRLKQRDQIQRVERLRRVLRHSWQEEVGIAVVEVEAQQLQAVWKQQQVVGEWHWMSLTVSVMSCWWLQQ